MRYETLNGHKIAFVDSPSEITFEQHHDFNLNLAIESGIGSDMESVNNHSQTITALIRSKEYKKALIEQENLRMNYYFILENINPKKEAFYNIMYSIDGVRCTKMNKDRYEAIVGQFKMSFFDIVDEVKKKLMTKWIFIILRITLWKIDIMSWLKIDAGRYSMR